MFEATSGDPVFGTLVGTAQDYVPGDTVATAFGRYCITAEEPFTSADTAPGHVRITR